MSVDRQTSAVAESLRALADGGDRSKTSRVRDLLPEIEMLKERGHTNERILIVLHEAGLEMSLKTFESILHRLRKVRRKDSGTLNAGQGNHPVSRPQSGIVSQFDPVKQLPMNPDQLRSLRSNSAEKANKIINREDL